MTHKTSFECLNAVVIQVKLLHMQFRQQSFLLCWLTQDFQLKLIEQQLVYANERTTEKGETYGDG